MRLDVKTKLNAKRLTDEEFDRLCRGNWRPVELEVGARPRFLTSLPDDKIAAVFGSASLDTPNPNADGNANRTSVGGIDVYRVAEESDGVALNKDWYAVHYEEDPDGSAQIYVVGPMTDDEHWIDELPGRLAIADSSSVKPTLPEAGDSSYG